MKETKQSRWVSKQVAEFTCHHCGQSVVKTGKMAIEARNNLKHRGYAYCNRQCAGASRRK